MCTTRSKDKSRRSKAAAVDPDTLAPPELEKMETGETILAAGSDGETSGLTEPEPLVLPDEMDVSTDSAPGMYTGVIVIGVEMNQYFLIVL